jgi:hypothetical protein
MKNIGSTSVSRQFGFDFTTDAVTSYKFRVPGDSFDSTVFESDIVNPFSSSGITIFEISFFSSSDSAVILVVNPTITIFYPTFAYRWWRVLLFNLHTTV